MKLVIRQLNNTIHRTHQFKFMIKNKLDGYKVYKLGGDNNYVGTSYISQFKLTIKYKI